MLELTALLPINQAYAEEAVTTASALPQLFLLVGFIAIFYFLIIRPQSKRAKAHKQLVANLSVGDEVATTSGLLGSITKITDDKVSLELADNLVVQMQKSHIASVLPKGTLKASA